MQKGDVKKCKSFFTFPFYFCSIEGLNQEISSTTGLVPGMRFLDSP